MKVVCAWCKTDLGEKAGPEGETSHGICKKCVAVVIALDKARYKAQMKEERA